MKIDFHDDHWWIVVNGSPAYRLSIPRDISPEEARKHATNVLIYLCERAEVGHPLSTAREGTTEGQPSCSLSDRSGPRDAAVSHPQGRAEHCHRRDFDEIDSLTAHLTQSRGQPSVGRDPVHASAREDPPVGVRDTNIVDVAISCSNLLDDVCVWYTDQKGRILEARVLKDFGLSGWRLQLTDHHGFVAAHAYAGWSLASWTNGYYRKREDCASAIVAVLTNVFHLPSAF